MCLVTVVDGEKEKEKHERDDMRLPPVTRALIRRMFAHFEQREKLNAQTN